jgi:hypothetical protein
MIVSILDKSAGFFSMFFFTMNQYIYCKKNKINFKLNSDNWMYKYDKGWTDYFNNIELKFNDDNNIEYKKHKDIIQHFQLREYKNIINEIYIYNNNTLLKINEIKNKFNLIENEYSSIFIRRGDKLLYESIFLKSEQYIELLLKKDPNCKNIFIQTDDYNAYLDLKKYCKNNNLNINIYTLCLENMKGIMGCRLNMQTKFSENIEYFKSIKEELVKNKYVCEMNKYEILEHTINMIVGIDIVLKSKYCITDYQSNVSRFIKLAHNDYNNVFSVIDEDFYLNNIVCPAFY